MNIEFSLNGSFGNKPQHELSFEQIVKFQWKDAIFAKDFLKRNPERRFVAVGFLNIGLYVICFAQISDGILILNSRKANDREAKRYVKQLALD